MKEQRMMELTRKGEYAIRAMRYLAQLPEGQVALVADIAKATEAPRNFTAKILQTLSKLHLARSSRGAGGGFALMRPASEISLRVIVEAMDGPIMPNRCLMRKGACPRDVVCAVHPVWRKVQGAAIDILDKATLADLAKA
jgi:Rrf2 family protein